MCVDWGGVEFVDGNGEDSGEYEFGKDSGVDWGGVMGTNSGVNGLNG